MWFVEGGVWFWQSVKSFWFNKQPSDGGRSGGNLAAHFSSAWHINKCGLVFSYLVFTTNNIMFYGENTSKIMECSA